MYQYRAQQILIEMPKPDSEPWVHITIQRLTPVAGGGYDDVIDRYKVISAPFHEILNRAFVAAVAKGKTVRITGGELAAAIKAAALEMIAEAVGARIEDGNVLED